VATKQYTSFYNFIYANVLQGLVLTSWFLSYNDRKRQIIFNKHSRDVSLNWLSTRIPFQTEDVLIIWSRIFQVRPIDLLFVSVTSVLDKHNSKRSPFDSLYKPHVNQHIKFHFIETVPVLLCLSITHTSNLQARKYPVHAVVQSSTAVDAIRSQHCFAFPSCLV